MADRDDRAARLRAVAAVWLRSSWLWRGLLVAGLVVGVFLWAMVVLGIALAMAQDGAEQWWLVLVFGVAILVVVLAGAYLLAARLFNRPARPSVSEAGHAAGAAGTAGSSAAAADAPSVPVAPPPATERPLEPLSERELQVLQLLATVRSNREIATDLYVATRTAPVGPTHAVCAVTGATVCGTRAEALAVLNQDWEAACFVEKCADCFAAVAARGSG